MNTRVLMMPKNVDQSVGEHRNEWHDLNRTITGLFFFIILVVLIVWGRSVLMHPQTLPIKNVRIEGEFRQLSPGTLQTIVAGAVKGGFFNVNVEAIQNALYRNPWVYEVTVRRLWPDGLSVQVTEQTAVARWGDQGLINASAVFFAPEQQTFPEHLPVFNGPENTWSLLFNRYVQVRELLDTRAAGVKSLTLDDRWAWSFILEHGPRIHLGRRDVTDRLERFVNFVYPGIEKRFDHIEVVDMRYTNGFAVKWKNNSSENIQPEQKNHG